VWERLDADPRFEVVVRPQLSSLVFRWIAGTDDQDALDALVPRVRAELFGSGEAVVGSTVVDGREYLKFTLLNPTTTVAQVMEVVEMIATHAAARTPAVAR
jgi:L-2,4-diaminobutyrate decarboxylase